MISIPKFLLPLLGLMLPFALPHAAQANPQPAYTVMVVPQFSETRTHASWGPLLEQVSKDTGIDFRLTFATDIPGFEQQFEQGKPDIIYCNPYHAVMAKKAQGYIPVLRDEQNLRGLLITEESGSIRTLQDLKGKTILFPSPNAFGSSLYLRALLKDKEKIDFTAKYVKTHPNVLRGILRGEGAAGGMIASTLNSEDEKLQDKMKVLYETPFVSSHPVAVHPRVPEAIRKKFTQALKKALLKLPNEASDVPMPNPQETTYAKDFQALENLGLEKYVVR
ncbi:MAG: phosphate/phosphite/phosphonate ABC transporter substrate-binding protein [Limnobacter sp.]|nr:phosphate/phosphite/phosphonate ABC transporter substrate-binding protein [Limnobacter sp.]